MTIGERIKAKRKELGLSQEELAHRLGNKSRASVSTVEHDKEDLTTTRIAAYAEALECTPACLMGWEDKADGSDKNRDHVDYVLNDKEGTLIELYRNNSKFKKTMDYFAEIFEKEGDKNE